MKNILILVFTFCLVFFRSSNGMERGEPRQFTIPDHQGENINVSADGKYIIIVTMNAILKIWEVPPTSGTDLILIKQCELDMEPERHQRHFSPYRVSFDLRKDFIFVESSSHKYLFRINLLHEDLGAELLHRFQPEHSPFDIATCGNQIWFDSRTSLGIKW